MKLFSHGKFTSNSLSPPADRVDVHEHTARAALFADKFDDRTGRIIRFRQFYMHSLYLPNAPKAGGNLCPQRRWFLFLHYLAGKESANSIPCLIQDLKSASFS